MSLAGEKRSFMFSLVVLLIISVLQIWVCSDCKVGAIRIFPANNWANHHHHPHEKFLSERKKKNNSEEMFKRFFNGGGRGGNFDLNRTKKAGFEDSKRRVPSCPDPLHNKPPAFSSLE